MNMKTMMKVMGLALAMGAMVAQADEAKSVAAQPAATAVDAASAPRKATARPKLTDAQRAEMKARREKFMAERRAKMEAKMLEIIKKYVHEEEKAKALVKELEEAMRTGLRGPKGHRIPARPAAKPAVPAAK